MICSNCGTENRPGARFCIECAMPYPGGCPTCGTNLNRATCECKRGWEDPRFAVLKKLKGE